MNKYIPFVVLEVKQMFQGTACVKSMNVPY